VKPEIVKQYVDTGKVQIIYKHSAFLGPESLWAAQASECAANQGKFWEYHDLLFERQQGENQGTFNKDKLIALAQELGLDMTQFEPCLNQDQTLERVQADTKEGQALGVRGTPMFFINGRPLSGALPFESFKTVIDQALSGQQ
jgi:protein-disulfide isomerase